jgi:hypothetical protein
VEDVIAAAEARADRSPMRMFDGQPFPASIWTRDIRAALNGEKS